MTIAIGLVLAAISGTASAQDVIPQDIPIDLERFRPPADTYGYALTESSTTLYNLQVGVGMWGNYSEDAAVLLFNNERVIGPGPDFPDAMIDRRSVVNLQAGLGIADIFSFTLDAPVVAWQEGFEPTAPDSTAPFTDLVSAGLGDMRLTPKFQIVDIHEGYPVGLAFLTRVSVPMGSKRSFIGEGTLTAEPMIAVEAANGSVHDREYQFRTAINLGGRLKPPDEFRGTIYGSEFVFRGALAVRPAPQMELGGDIAGELMGSRVSQFPLEILPWLRLFPTEWVQIGGGLGIGLNPGLGAPDIRFWGGGSISPSFDPLSLDRDHDGIPNKFDVCINIPEDIDQFEDEDGCPEDDNDKDGILDEVDGCPNDPEDVDTFQDSDGCPDPDNDRDGILDLYDRCPMDPEDVDDFQDNDGCPDPDNDQDGILDVQDACPNAAETFNGYDDADGCPDEEPHVDTDADGYVDAEDSCPFDPEDFDGFEDDNGCPDTDNDQDGIFDVSDSCPNEPETANNYMDEDGCPDDAPSRVVVEKTKIRISDKIFFEYNKAVIQSVSFELLDEVARVINDHTAIAKIQVEGHTDADGSESYNQKLSQRRAESVVAYLIDAGVDSGRLAAVGFGETKPIDTNKTTEGKANNRRVEFTILDE